MRLFSTVDLRDQWECMTAHERSHYGDAYLEARERVLEDWWSNCCHWWVALADMETTLIQSSASATLLSMSGLLQMIRDGNRGPKSLCSYYKTLESHGDETPVLYISSIIIADRMHAPYLFKALSRELKEAQQKWGFSFDLCASIAMNKKAKFLLERNAFEPIGLCRGKYPIYQVHRAKAPLIDALLG